MSNPSPTTEIEDGYTGIEDEHTNVEDEYTDTEDKYTDIETIVEAKDEAAAIVDREIEWLKESETDFMRIFRFNVLTLGVFVSAASLAIRYTDSVTVSHFDHVFVYGSFGFWFASTVLAVLTYGGLRAQLGSEELFQVQSTMFSDVRSLGSRDEFGDLENHFDQTALSEVNSVSEYHRAVLDSYVKAINANEHEAGFRYGMYNVVLLLLAFSITLFGLGVWDAATTTRALVGPYGAGVIVGLLGIALIVVGGVPCLINFGKKYWNKGVEFKNAFFE